MISFIIFKIKCSICQIDSTFKVQMISNLKYWFLYFLINKIWYIHICCEHISLWFYFFGFKCVYSIIQTNFRIIHWVNIRSSFYFYTWYIIQRIFRSPDTFKNLVFRGFWIYKLLNNLGNFKFSIIVIHLTF